MRGSLKQRYKGSWSIILDLGYEPDATTGMPRRKQKWVTFRGTRKQAEAQLTELVRASNRGEFMEPSKLTLGAWLTEWLDKCIKPRPSGGLRASTYSRYRGIVEQHIQPSTLATIPLQKLRSSDLERFYAEQTLAPATVALYHAVLHRAIEKARKDRLVLANVATDVDGKPKPAKDQDEARRHCWTVTEARAFLGGAQTAGAQPGAFYALALDTGARKAELCGLFWTAVDLDAGTVMIEQQLTSHGRAVTFGPTKNGKARRVTLAPETSALLRAHKRHQAEIKMANRTVYHEHGLVFAKEWTDVRSRQDSLGQPLQMTNLGQREYARVTKAAGVRPIKFHGLRHTCATLLLKAGEPVHVVAERLGHTTAVLLKTYAHVTTDMQKQAAVAISGALYG